MIASSNGPPERDELIGQPCGGSYVITALLGEGGMGAVYLANSEALAGAPAAVKVLLPDLTRRSEGLARFRAEVYAAGKIAAIDPNIVKVFDTGELRDGRVYMLMEYCSGGSLAGLIEQRGALPLELILTTLSPIGSALETAHTEAKITHRDIKPANILLLRDGGLLRGKLGDFGIAKLHDLQLGFLKTGTQKILGSPGYMAPEQCGGKGGVDSRADVYAFGSVLYEAVTGQRPYSGNSLFDLIQNVVSNAPFPPPGKLRRDLPPEWEAVIMGCLAHRREDRIQTVKEVIRRLARSIPNGESLMAFVAPRLVDDKTAPTAVTIPDGIGPAATQWVSAAPFGISGGRRRVGPLAVAIAAGIVVGGGIIGIADRIGRGSNDIIERDTRDTTAAVSAGVRQDAAVMAVVLDVTSDHVVPRDASIAVAAAPAVDAAKADTTMIAADAKADAPTVDTDAAVAVDVAHAVVRLPDKAQADRSTQIVRVPTTPPGARAATPVLVVRVKPFAEVTIDNVAAGTTPVRKIVSTGVHHVVLVGSDKREELDVTVGATKETTITRSW